MDFIITWSDGLGRVGTGEYLYDIMEKPELGFDFDAIYFETPTKMYIKLFDGVQSPLTEEEIELCIKYCENFYQSDAYMIHAVDPDMLTYVGYISRGQAKREGYIEAVGASFPDSNFVKWIDNKWERIVAAIDEHGSLYLLPANDELKFNFVFSEKEWAEFVKPSYIDEHYDFKSKSWVDGRDLITTKAHAKDRIRASYLSSFRAKDLVHYEMDTLLYMIQVMEASAWKKNTEASTPFVDAVIAENGNTKEEFMNRILSHYTSDYLSSLGTIHGRQYALLDKIDACSSIEELDTIMFEALADAQYPWRKPMKVDPYATVN